MPVAVTEKPLNVRLPFELANQLESLAKATDKTKSFLAVEALREYLEVQAWQIAEIKAGIAEADRGEFATDEEVQAIFAKYAN
jgi:RHH-type transcriptional regulator, rel operon repressor / antitoxin RelB